MLVNQQLLKKSIKILLKMRVEYQNQLDAWKDDKVATDYYLAEISLLEDHLEYMLKMIEIESYYPVENDGF